MIKPDTIQLLEFNKILDLISEFSNSDAAQKLIREIRPMKDKAGIEKRFGQILEIQRLTQENDPLKMSRFQDLSQQIIKIRPENAVLEASELLPFMILLRLISEISSQIRGYDFLPLLNELTAHLTGFPDILRRLEKSISGDGTLLDTASPELSRLRSSIRTLEVKIRKNLEVIVRNKRTSTFLQDDFITKRAGRWVIPVRMDSKGQVPGVVHDVSRSGDTAFVEPMEIIGLTNELENLIADEKTEEIRILREICQSIRRVLDDLNAQYQAMVYLDLLNSIARFAESLRMNVPQINSQSLIKLVEAKHPLLLVLKRDGIKNEVVPLNLELGKNGRVMVITGPNAGGKTVVIKTLGLLLLMALSGIPVPADSSSSFPLLNELLVDIGDEQSIESSLSTFSAHVSNISNILKNADTKSVVLLDELGTGTEPLQGAAIGCSVLKALKERGALVFATTHLTDIVGFVYKNEGMLNASMQFDQETFTPLYRLTIGEPGQSHALEIARRYGLPGDIIDFAKGLLGNIQIEFHNLLTELKKKREDYEKSLFEVQKQKNELEEKNRILNDKLQEAKKQEKDILKRAYEDSQELILSVKREVNALLEEAKKERKRETVKKLHELEEQVKQNLREFKKEVYISIDEIKEGDIVFVGSVGYDAEVLRIDKGHNRLTVRAGNMEVEVPASEVFHKKKDVSFAKASVYRGSAEIDKAAIPELNVIGLRVDEALSKIEPFLNHALLDGIDEVTIIHGKGTGALQRGIREYLKPHPLVKSFRSGTQGEGGEGVTVVTLK